mgnify:CR=1 FL=1
MRDLSLRARICLLCSTTIMLTFFIVKTLLLLGIIDYSKTTNLYEYFSVILFMPPFFLVVQEFLAKKKWVTQQMHKKNVFLEHSAKIIRHDMHSGINTYLPRGIKSLKRRLTDADIERLKLKAPLQLIEDGLFHSQKVYAGVYEFTNLVKEGATLTRQECNVKEILDEYLKLTTYKSQVILSDNLPTSIEINEALFCTALDNLIRNGLKYNDSGRKWVKIYLEANYHSGSFIIVEDNGRGMTREQFYKFSEPYTRIENQKETGTGLGLNIAIEILKTHDFSIWADKQPKGGTKIYIKI